MSYPHGGAFGAGLNNWAGVQLGSRAEPVAYPHLHARNDSSTGNQTDTVNLYIDSGGNTEYEYAASIVTACADQTVYAARCTAGPSTTYVPGLGNIDSGCGSDGPVVTLTEGPSKYIVSTATSTSTRGTGVAITIAETCALSGTTAAVCTATVFATVGQTSTSTTSTTTATGTSYARYDVAITAGADKTKNPAATCAAANAAPGLSAKGVAVWALAGFAGLAGFLAM